MNRLDRALGILLLLSSGQACSAERFAKHFEVSKRTIYRDIETLNALGVPVVSEHGPGGGYHLMERYFLPPVAFTPGEAISLLLGLLSLKSHRITPFAGELESARHKLLTVLPEHLRKVLTEAEKVVGFEGVAQHAVTLSPDLTPFPTKTLEANIVEVFFRALLEGITVRLHYHSPYRSKSEQAEVIPLGLLWDRDLWYLVADKAGEQRLFRADRVQAIEPYKQQRHHPNFDVRELLNRAWLEKAMREWMQEAKVKIRLTGEQARRLQKDWYYGHAFFEPSGSEHVVMTLGEDNQVVVFELLRWLGPGTELLEPGEWRDSFRAELQAMLETYA